MRIIISLFTLVIVAGCSLIFLLYINNPTNQQLSEEDKILRLIADTSPAFSHEGKLVIKINSLAKFENKWYIISISSLRETKQHVPVYFILLETDNTLQVVLGPETHFTEAEMLRNNLPDSVILELQKYEKK